MRKIGYFKRLETGRSDDGRPDANEGVVSWRQPDRVELKIEMPGFQSIVLGKGDLAGPISISRDFYSEMHIYCLTVLCLPDPAELKGDREEVRTQMQAAFQVNEGCLSFGEYAVILSADRFLPQLKRALKKCNHWFRADAVQYYDETSFHGDFGIQEVPFRKQRRFAYQKEYRICLQTPVEAGEEFVFDVGDMSDYAIKAKSCDLNSALKVTFRS